MVIPLRSPSLEKLFLPPHPNPITPLTPLLPFPSPPFIKIFSHLNVWMFKIKNYLTVGGFTVYPRLAGLERLQNSLSRLFAVRLAAFSCLNDTGSASNAPW